MSTVNIAGIDKAELLAALYNNARPLGLGMLQFRAERMTAEQARKDWIDKGKSHDSPLMPLRPGDLYFDYVHGRPLKVDLSTDELRTDLYNRDQGHGAAERIVAELRAAKDAAQ